MNKNYAGLRPRFVAFILDYLVILVYIAILSIVTRIIFLFVEIEALQNLLTDPIRYDLFAFTILVLPVILYFALSEGSARQATWGKQRMRMQVVSSSGGRLGYGRALLRAAVKFLPWQVAHTTLFHIPGWPFAPEGFSPPVIAGFALVWVLVGIYLASLLITKTHQTPYDRIAGAFVLVLPKTGQINETALESLDSLS